MRYAQVETITVQDPVRGSLPVKEMREIPEHAVLTTVQRAADEPFDAVAARPTVYGEGGEALAWKLHEAMTAEIVDARFDYSRLARVRVPE